MLHMSRVVPLCAALVCAASIIFVIAFSPAADGQDGRLERIHGKFVFIDTHAHPSQFHRANVERIDAQELERYRRGYMDMVVCSVSSDAAYQGGYTNRDGTALKRLQAPNDYTLKPGEAFAFTLDRFLRIVKTADDARVVLALNPAQVLKAKKDGQLALMAALEGADGLEGKIENLKQLYKQGLRLVQLVHFRSNNLGSVQTKPYSEGGLLPFGAEVVQECNRMGIVIDLAHANNRTIVDTVKLSKAPVVFSHTGAKALQEGDRNVTDEEIRAIAAKGGLIGIWPSSSFPEMADMVKHIDHVKRLAGIDHVSIGSDLRGMSYTKEFGEDANFRAIAEALMTAGYTDEEVGKVMGGNFFRLWQQISKN
jgi:membrane dipeptidase